MEEPSIFGGESGRINSLKEAHSRQRAAAAEMWGSLAFLNRLSSNNLSLYNTVLYYTTSSFHHGAIHRARQGTLQGSVLC